MHLLTPCPDSHVLEVSLLFKWFWHTIELSFKSMPRASSHSSFKEIVLGTPNVLDCVHLNGLNGIQQNIIGVQTSKYLNRMNSEHYTDLV